MAHTEQFNYVQELMEKFPQYRTGRKVLEVGSLNLNGTIRIFFDTTNYIGLDIGPGPCVDVVCLGHEYDAPSESFDVCCSTECFEHNPYWFETFENMIRLCKSDGLVFFTCASSGREPHGLSHIDPEASPLTVARWWDYYRNLEQKDFEEKMNFAEYFKEWQFQTNEKSFDLYFYGIKK